MPDDERKARRLGDETKSRIADLASGWTVGEDDDPPRAPEPYVRRKAKTVPPPAPGSAARKALGNKLVELGDVFDSLDGLDNERPAPPPTRRPAARALSDVLGGAELDLGDEDDEAAHSDDHDDDDDELAPPPPPRSRPPTPPPPAIAPSRPRSLTGPAPAAKRARHDGGDPLDINAIPAADKTQENRGAVGKSGAHKVALSSNAVSGTIGDQTPAPVFDRAALAAGQKGALAADRVARPAASTRGTPIADAPPNATVVGTGVARGPAAAGEVDRRPLPSAPPAAPAPFWPGTGAPLPSASPAAPEPSWPSSSPAKPLAKPLAKPPAKPPAADVSKPTRLPDAEPDDSGVLVARPDKRSVARDDESGILVSGPDHKLAARSDDSELAPPARAEKRSFFGRSVGPTATSAQPIVAPSKLATAPAPSARPADARAQPVSAAPAQPVSAAPSARLVPAPPIVGSPPPARSAEPRRRSTTSSVPALLQEPLVPSGRNKRPTAAEPLPVVVEPKPDDSIVELDASALTADDSGKHPVPVGEFESAQATVVRDPASALLHIPAPPEPIAAPEPTLDEPVRGDPTFDVVPGDRGDPTIGDDREDATSRSASDKADPTIAAIPTSAPRAARSRPTAGTLRTTAALPRRQGFFGDIRYVFTALFGVRRANRELDELDARQTTRQQSRRHHLIALGRAAVLQREWRAPGGTREHAALAPARTQLDALEAERTQHAAQVVAADEELAHVRADRDAAGKQHTADVAAIDTELADLARKLEPLEKEAAAVKKRGAELKDTMRRADGKIAATEASLRHPKGGQDPVALQAELATLKADRKAIQRDEPVIAGELDALSPRIAAIEAARAEARSKRAEHERAEAEDLRRTADLLAAIGAKRKVVERAVADAEAAADKILLALGERLYVDRPDDLSPQLAPVDELDVELAGADRRMMELRELTASVDRWKVSRGVLYLLLIFGTLGAAAYFLIPLFT